MRKVAAALAFAVLVGGFLIGNLQPAVSQAPGNQTLTFFDPRATDFEKEIDEGRKGFSAGDWSVIKDRVFDPDTCAKAGDFLGRFTFIKSSGRNNGYFLVEAGVITPDGKLVFDWPGKFSDFENPSPTTGGAITGGTGIYTGAGGTITVEEDVQMCEKTGAVITIELEP